MARVPKRKSGDITIEVPAAQITWDEILAPALRKPFAAKLSRPRKNPGLLAFEQKRKTSKEQALDFCFDRWTADPGLLDRHGETKFVMMAIERVTGFRILLNGHRRFRPPGYNRCRSITPREETKDEENSA
jgi:hypothetical protein